jgi:hypothetical protein
MSGLKVRNPVEDLLDGGLVDVEGVLFAPAEREVKKGERETERDRHRERQRGETDRERQSKR